MFFDTSPWGQFALDIFLWTSVNETLIYDESNILKTSCQIKLWNFLLQLETTKKSLNFLSESYIFHRHRVKKQKQIDDKSADRDDPSSTFRLYVVKFSPNVTLYIFSPKFWTFFPPNFGEKSVPKWWFQNSNVVSTCRTWWCFLTPCTFFPHFMKIYLKIFQKIKALI